METEVINLEEEGAQGGGSDAPVAEDTAGAAEPAAQETAPAADAAAGEGDGDRTADPEAAGASSAAPAADSSAKSRRVAWLAARSSAARFSKSAPALAVRTSRDSSFACLAR